MYKEFFAKSPLLALPLVSLVIFVGLFVIVLAYVMRRGKAMESRGQLALDREVGHE